MKRKRTASSTPSDARGHKSLRKHSGNDADRDEDNATNCYHSFTKPEILKMRALLLGWYDENKRDLPWRVMGKRSDINERAYAVWVSEIMLQQTQVATVVEYYNAWMKKWPTLEALAGATLEQVNEMWAGLGYYSRGRRLHEGAQKVVKELKGQMPRTSATLEKELPGVGRYTASAIASIAYEEASGVVDGNVIRVFTRMQGIGANSASPTTLEAIWSLANSTVDPTRPGDFNQAMMELGATVCTPKTPTCKTCPVQKLCKANAQVENFKKHSTKRLMGNGCHDDAAEQQLTVPDIECASECCHLCPPPDAPWDSSIGVLNYPRKPKKKTQRQEKTAVCVIQRNRGKPEYLIVQRPQGGLLAGLWEFPSVSLQDGASEKTRTSLMDIYLQNEMKVKFKEKTKRRFVGEVVHIFSHIHQTYIVETFHGVDDDEEGEETDVMIPRRWVTKEQFLESAVSTAMKKVFKAFDEPNKKNGTKVSAKSKSQSLQSSSVGKKKQLGLSAFFKPVKDIT